jgi:NTP pyrophosphatase (non-canonical NTP hydrolase)
LTRVLQERARDFVERAFGHPVFVSVHERVRRILEEAVELCQAEDLPLPQVMDITHKVYARPKGKPEQELAGVAVTAFAYAELLGLQLLHLADLELARVEALPTEHFQKRHAEKIALGMSDAALAPHLKVVPPVDRDAKPIWDPPTASDEWRNERLDELRPQGKAEVQVASGLVAWTGENQRTINEWQVAMFKHVTPLQAFARLHKEFSELLTLLAYTPTNSSKHDEWAAKVAPECADLYVVLCQLCNELGVDLQDEVNKKMAINRKRVWAKTKDGDFQHVKQEQQSKPIDMVLFCPKCGLQHIDAPGGEHREVRGGELVVEEWTNPPHRSHLCARCKHIWRPADVPTNGVFAIATRGGADSPPPIGPAATAVVTGHNDPLKVAGVVAADSAGGTGPGAGGRHP